MHSLVLLQVQLLLMCGKYSFAISDVQFPELGVQAAMSSRDAKAVIAARLVLRCHFKRERGRADRGLAERAADEIGRYAAALPGRRDGHAGTTRGGGRQGRQRCSVHVPCTHPGRRYQIQYLSVVSSLYKVVLSEEST